MAQTYRLFSHAVWPGDNQFDAQGGIILQNLDEAQTYLNEYYLAQGYKVLSVENLREVVVDSTNPFSPRGFQFEWHLVKDEEDKKSAKKANDQ